MNCISISYKNAKENIRSNLAFSIDIQRKISEELNKCVVLCTCNRTEIYFNGEYEYVLEILAKYSNFTSCFLKKYSMFFCGKSAESHLFNVACGIESMVIGEDEILGQVKNAYYNAYEWNKTNREINIIFQSAIACAKKIKTETSLSNVSVSTATLTANEASEFCENPEIMVIGASGKIGQTIVKNLLSHKNVSVTATLRNHSPELFVGNFSNFSTVNYKERYKIIDKFDCIISATTGPHYTITYNELENNLITQKKRLFIDLAVPHDIDRKICDDENIRLIGIDYFEELAKENNIKKYDSVETAKKYIADEIEVLEKELAMHDFVSRENIDINELKVLGKLKQKLNAEQFSAVLKAMEKE